MGQAADFFVSYSSADRAWAEWIAWQLEAEGYQVIVQAWDFTPGRDWAADGSLHVTGTLTGTVVVTPLDPTQPTYTGRFTTWFGFNLNSRNEGSWETFSVRLTGSDGSRLLLNEVSQFHVSATGEITVEFTNTNCR